MSDFLDSVEEQKRVKTELKKICNLRRAPHAFIFSGVEGIGKFYTAIQFAKELTKSVNPEISNDIIKKIDELTEPYIKFIFPLPRGKGEVFEDSGFEKLSKDVLAEIHEEIRRKIDNPFYKITIESANTIKISSIREIRKFLSFSHVINQTRFVIIDQAHLMNDQSQNALLKNLEEPPENVYFILITHRRDDLLATILSRCREIKFDPLTPQAIKQILCSHFLVEDKTAKDISRFAEGSIQRAFEFLQYDFEKVLEKAVSILRFSFGKKYQKAFEELSEFTETNSTKSITILLQLIRYWILDALKNRKEVVEYTFEDHVDTFSKFNQKYNKTNLISPFTMLEKLESHIGSNINLNVLFLNIIFELSAVIKRT